VLSNYGTAAKHLTKLQERRSEIFAAKHPSNRAVNSAATVILFLIFDFLHFTRCRVLTEDRVLRLFFYHIGRESRCCTRGPTQLW